MENLENMTPLEYLDSVVEELKADPDWELPPEKRVFLGKGYEWDLLGM